MTRTIYSAAAALFAGLLLLSGCSSGDAGAQAPGAPGGPAGPRAVAVELAVAGALERTLPLQGELLAQRVVEVAPLESGRLVELLVDEGDRVTAGQVIARLEADVQNDARTQASAAVATAEQRLAVQQSSRDAQQREVDRRAELASRNAFPSSDLERLTDALATAEQSVALAEAELSEARSRLRSSSTSIGRRSVVAPFDGVVTARHLTPGATVSPSTSLFTLVDETSLELRARIPESMVSRVEAGTPVHINFDAQPETVVAGEIFAIGNVVDRESRTVEVRIRVTPGTVELRHGMYARGEAVVESVADAVHVPLAALENRESPTARIWTVVDGKAVPFEGAVTVRTELRVAVAGLAPGTVVIVSPPRGLAEGADVRPVGLAAEGSGTAP